MYTVYIIKCRDEGYYYVGKTAYRGIRFSQHSNKWHSAKFVERHGFDSVVKETTVLSDEDAKRVERDWVISLLSEGYYAAGGGYTSEQAVIKAREKFFKGG